MLCLKNRKKNSNSSTTGRNIPNQIKNMLQKIPVFSKKKKIIFPFSMKKRMLLPSKISKVTLALTKEPPWNNIFQQSFSPNTQVEKFSKINRSISLSNSSALYLKFNQNLEIEPRFCEKNKNTWIWSIFGRNIPNLMKLYVTGISNSFCFLFLFFHVSLKKSM